MAALLLIAVIGASPAWAEEDCSPGDRKEIKVEGYISKKFKKDERKIYKEFKEAGPVRVALRTFPMGDTSRHVAVGRCVPAAVARHVLRKAMEYTSGVGTLVVQDFVPAHWVGIGTTMFDEPSQQAVTPDQVEKLLDPNLTDEQFHAMYREFSRQDAKVPYFGLEVPNAKMRSGE